MSEAEINPAGIIEAALQEERSLLMGGTFSNVVDDPRVGIYDRLVASGGGGLAVQLALEQLRAAGVQLVEAERREAFADIFGDRPPELPRPIAPEPPRFGPVRRSGFVDIHEPTNWKPGAVRPAGSKLARKASKGRL